MLAAFSIVGGCATLSVISFTLSRYNEDAQTQLLGLTKILSLQISTEQQIGLNRTDEKLYRKLNEGLEQISRQSDHVRRIYTLRKVDRNYEMVLDTQVERSMAIPASIFSPTAGISREAKDVFESGLPAVDRDIAWDRNGPYFTAYAPLTDSKGRVRAILAVDRDAKDIAGYMNSLQRATWMAFAMVFLLGALFSFIIVRQLARNAKSEAWLRGVVSSRKILRATLLELILAGLATAVLGLGIYSQVRIGQLRAGENTSMSQSQSLEQYRNRIDRVLRDNTHDISGLRILSESAEKDSLTWLSKNLNSSIRANEGWRDPLWQAQAAIRTELENERKLRDSIRADIGEMSEHMTSALVIAILLSFGSLILVRGAAKQQQELLIAKHDSQRHQVAYEQVATNLPIGFYTFRDDRVEDANSMWDTMVTRMPGEDRMMALERAVHEEDLPELKQVLWSAEDTNTPFHLRFRLRASMEEIRHYETRGLWVSKPDEGIDNILGFFVDVTDFVDVHEKLEYTNSEIQAKNLMLTRALTDLEDNFEAMVRSLVKAVEAKDPYTAGHSERVMRYSVAIGQVFGLSAHDLRVLERATLIHDVGKIGVPDAILNKPGKLTDEEFKVIQSHPGIGAQMVRGIPAFEECVPIILWHHERLDGTGYPDGLHSGEIPTLVRITSVADVFDALTSRRAYRAALGVDEALAILRKDAAAGILDGKIVETLADIVLRDGILWHEPRSEAA